MTYLRGAQMTLSRISLVLLVITAGATIGAIFHVESVAGAYGIGITTGYLVCLLARRRR